MVATPAKPRFFLGWTVVAAAAMTAIAQVAFFNPVLGVFIPEFEREFGWSRTEISLGATVGTICAAMIGPYFGPLIDRYGGKIFIAGGGLIMTIGLIALANMQTEWQFFVIYAVGRSMATGLLSVAATVTVSKWFIRKRGLAVGLTTIGTRIGFATMPVGVQLIIDESGWRTSCYVLAGVVATLGILPAVKWLHQRPELYGLLPDGATEDLNASAHGRPSPPREENWTRKEALKTRAFWLITFAISLQTFAGGAVNLHQIPYMVDRGISSSDAAVVLSLFAVFAGLGGLLEGALDTTVGARITFIVGLIGSSIGMVVLMNTSTFQMGLVFAAGYGVAFGLMLTSQQVVFADYFGREALGAIRGASLPMFMTFQAMGPIFGGVIFDVTGSYMAAFVLFTIGYLIAAVAMFFSRRPVLPPRPIAAPIYMGESGAPP